MLLLQVIAKLPLEGGISSQLHTEIVVMLAREKTRNQSRREAELAAAIRDREERKVPPQCHAICGPILGGNTAVQ